MTDTYRFRVACPAQHSYVAMVRPDPLIYALWLRDHASCEAITGHSGDETVRPTQGYQDRANAMCVESGKSVSDLR